MQEEQGAILHTIEVSKRLGNGVRNHMESTVVLWYHGDTTETVENLE
jgi:hypothetical protein